MNMNNFLEIFEAKAVSVEPIHIENMIALAEESCMKARKNPSDVDYVSAVTSLDILYRLRAGKIRGI